MGRANQCRIQTLLFTVGPLLLPKVLSFYRTQRAKAVSSPVPVRPAPRHALRALNILFISCVIAFVSSLPFFSPENIFTVTSSRLQTSNDVLFTRLSYVRPQSTLTEDDTTLKPRIASLDSRLLYLTYGPDVLTHCSFCKSDDPTTYLYYALPSILLPHLLHLLAIGLATSSAISGKHGSRWRTSAAVGGATLALSECYLFGTYDWKGNARVHRPEDLVHFYWRMRTVRGLGIAAMDAAFAGFVWASSTNRLFVVPPSDAERMEGALKVLESLRGKMTAVSIMRNVVVRDEGLRKTTEGYWKQEGQVMGQVMDEREVVEGVRNALSGRVSVGKVEEDAKKYAEGVVGWREQIVNQRSD